MSWRGPARFSAFLAVRRFGSGFPSRRFGSVLGSLLGSLLSVAVQVRRSGSSGSSAVRFVTS